MVTLRLELPTKMMSTLMHRTTSVHQRRGSSSASGASSWPVDAITSLRRELPPSSVQHVAIQLVTQGDKPGWDQTDHHRPPAHSDPSKYSLDSRSNLMVESHSN